MSNEFVFKPAVKEALKGRVALVGPSGSGKTMSALRVARGMVGPGGKIAVVDTEFGKSRLYARSPKNPTGVTEFEVLDLRPPYTPDRYMGAWRAAVSAGFDICITDSLSHAWMGEGGVLDQVDQSAARAAAKSGRSKDSFGAWRDVTPQQNAMVNAILASPIHMIVCMRAKTAFEITEENGRKKIEKLGMQAQQREGMDFEMDVVGDIDAEHTVRFSKTRCAALDGKAFKFPGEQLGEQIAAWLDDGAERMPERLADCKTVEHVKNWCATNKPKIAKADEAKVAELREQLEVKAESLGIVAAEAFGWAGMR